MSNETDRATPRPWKTLLCQGGWYVVDADNRFVAAMTDGTGQIGATDEARAALIVAAMSNERLSLKCRSCECRISQAEADAGAALVEGMGCETMCEDCARKMAGSKETNRATPRPWRIETGRATDHVADDIFIVDANGAEVAKLATSLDESDGEKAALIVRAVNSHEKLVEACEYLMGILTPNQLYGKPGQDEPLGITNARTALALARGN